MKDSLLEDFQILLVEHPQKEEDLELEFLELERAIYEEEILRMKGEIK